MSTKHHDSSHVGNDCYIHEHWYWIPEPQGFVLKATKVDGWGSGGVGIETFESQHGDHDMPPEVIKWFEEQQL